MTFPFQPIQGMFHKLTSCSEQGECTFSEDCLCDFMAMDDQGNLYPCGRFCDAKAFSFGTVSDHTPFPLRANMQPDLRKYIQSHLEECKECRFRGICNGGCPFVSWNHKEKNPLCKDYQKIFTFFICDALDLMKECLQKRQEVLRNELE